MLRNGLGSGMNQLNSFRINEKHFTFLGAPLYSILALALAPL
ncbi:MAG: hypothetical protein AAF985_02345 [Bacteroidota bacterium]